MLYKLPTLLSRLISTPSVSCTDPAIDQSNRPVIDMLSEWFDALGFACEIQTVDEAGGKYNLIATRGKGNAGLVLAGHTDTVPFDAGRWQHDPFKLTEADNRFYGLGIADMKSFFALVLEAIREIDLDKLQQPLIVLATSDEETSMDGAKAIARHGLENARYAVIGEPTGLKPVRMHKGIMMQSIRLTGRSGHSSNPAYGVNAMEAMHKVMSDLLQWRRELQQEHHNPMFEVPVTTLNFGHIHGGDNPNRICGQCELQIDIRPIPGISIAELTQQLQQRLQALLEKDAVKLEITPLFDGIDAMETPASSELVRFVEKHTASESQAVAFGTEAPFYNAMGIDTIVLGPGNIAQAHQPDEYLELATINPYVATLKQLIRRFCY